MKYITSFLIASCCAVPVVSSEGSNVFSPHILDELIAKEKPITHVLYDARHPEHSEEEPMAVVICEDQATKHLDVLLKIMNELLQKPDEQVQRNIIKALHRSLFHLGQGCHADAPQYCLKELEHAVEDVVTNKPPFPRVHIAMAGVECFKKKYPELSSRCKTAIATLHDPKLPKYLRGN